MGGCAVSILVRDLTPEHVGQRVLGIDQIQGWAPHLLLHSVEHGEGTTTLMFRWDDDPSPSNTQRGRFACGVTIPSDTWCRVNPASDGAS